MNKTLYILWVKNRKNSKWRAFNTLTEEELKAAIKEKNKIIKEMNEKYPNLEKDERIGKKQYLDASAKLLSGTSWKCVWTQEEVLDPEYLEEGNND